jgi:hypothetical protein
VNGTGYGVVWLEGLRKTTIIIIGGRWSAGHPMNAFCVVCGKCLVRIWAGTIVTTAKALSCFSQTFQAYSGKYLKIGHGRFLSRPFFLIYYSLPFSHSHTLVSSRECFRITRIACRDVIIIRGPARETVVYACWGSCGELKHS